MTPTSLVSLILPFFGSLQLVNYKTQGCRAEGLGGFSSTAMEALKTFNASRCSSQPREASLAPGSLEVSREAENSKLLGASHV